MIYIIIGVIVIILIYIMITYNTLSKLKIRVEEAFSTMDIYLKKRWDLIPKLVDTVKAYTKYEKEVLETITKIRKESYDNMNLKDKLDTNHKLTNKLDKLMTTIESYPELKASENFIELSNQLTKIEEDIANSRKYYNGTVRILNEKIVTFPSGLIAKIFRFKQEKMYEAHINEKTM